MLKLLVYTDGKAASSAALHYAAALKQRLAAELAVITVRPGTHSVEDPPPVGRPVALDEQNKLSPGLQALVEATQVLSGQNIMALPEAITIRDIPQGYMFVCKSASGDRIPFYECYGNFIDVMNKEVDRQSTDLLVIAPPRRKGLKRLVAGDTTRKLCLDLHTSILVVRGGAPDSRHLVCADGSSSARRQFPLIKHLLPAIEKPLDIIFVKQPQMEDDDHAAALTCIHQARQWLRTCGKMGTLIEKEATEAAAAICAEAGKDSVILMGASLRHDVYRRMRGSLPMQILDETQSSVLLVKLPAEAGNDFLKAPFTCD